MSAISGALLPLEDLEGSDEVKTKCVWFQLIVRLTLCIALCILDKWPELTSLQSQSNSSSRDVQARRKKRQYCNWRYRRGNRRNKLKKWPGLRSFQSQSSSCDIRKRKYHKTKHRRGEYNHRKLVTKFIQSNPLTVVVWALNVYNCATGFFRKQKRKRKRTRIPPCSPSSVRGVSSNPFVLKTESEVALFRGETMPTRNQQQSNPPKESSNPADSGIATSTSGASEESKRKPELQPDTSTLAVGGRSQHQDEDQNFTFASSHGAHRIPPDSKLLILSHHHNQVPPEKPTELPLAHTPLFAEREEFKPAVSTFECRLGDERNSWDDGLPPGAVGTDPPQSLGSVVKVQ